MKVILVDNYNRETVADKLLKDNLSATDAAKTANDYNKKFAGMNWDWFAKAVPDDYHLSRGIEDLI